MVALLLDPLVTNERAHRFYERLGFERAERRMFGDDDCYVYGWNGPDGIFPLARHRKREAARGMKPSASAVTA